MSDPRSPETAFDPEKFMSYVRQVGHGGALGIAYVAHGGDWPTRSAVVVDTETPGA